MFALEGGPFNLCFMTRSWIVQSGTPDWIAEGLECPMCISFWLGLMAYPRRPIRALACSGVVVFAYSIELILKKSLER